MEQQLIGLFCDIDEFCEAFEDYWHRYLVTDYRPVMPKCAMALLEIMTIAVLFHLCNQRTFKRYHKEYVCGVWKDYFPKQLSYNRFVSHAKRHYPTDLYHMKFRAGKCLSISFMDSATLNVCHNRQIHSEGLAKRGKSSTGWFYGFKLLVINDCGEVLSFCLTPGNADNRDWKMVSKLTAEIYGKLFAKDTCHKSYLINYGLTTLPLSRKSRKT